jgi:hypothetical protein
MLNYGCLETLTEHLLSRSVFHWSTTEQFFFYIFYIYLQQRLFQFLTELLHWLLSKYKEWIKNTCRVNPLTPNDPYRGRTASLTSKRCILYIYSTNIGTEYF